MGKIVFSTRNILDGNGLYFSFQRRSQRGSVPAGGNKGQRVGKRYLGRYPRKESCRSVPVPMHGNRDIGNLAKRILKEAGIEQKR
jgi:hypothetical protein